MVQNGRNSSTGILLLPIILIGEFLRAFCHSPCAKCVRVVLCVRIAGSWQVENWVYRRAIGNIPQ